ncbi:unnamed protein product, partial [Discosporangium mesarthrocarpum]
EQKKVVKIPKRVGIFAIVNLGHQLDGTLVAFGGFLPRFWPLELKATFRGKVPLSEADINHPPLHLTRRVQPCMAFESEEKPAPPPPATALPGLGLSGDGPGAPVSGVLGVSPSPGGDAAAPSGAGVPAGSAGQPRYRAATSPGFICGVGTRQGPVDGHAVSSGPGPAMGVGYGSPRAVTGP